VRLRTGQDRKFSSAPDRKISAGPIGTDSPEISSVQSSSSPAVLRTAAEDDESHRLAKVAESIVEWAATKGLQRRREDHRVGLPDRASLTR
jgi:hypothetical protein